MKIKHSETGLLFTFSLVAFPMALSASEGPSLSSIDWRGFLGPFHNVILHYPIGFVTMACILEFYMLIKGQSKAAKDIIRIVLWLTIGSTVLTATLGFARASDGGYSEHTLQMHKMFGILVILATTLAMMTSRRAFRDGASLWWRFLYQILLLISFAAMATTGHKGGDLTHGTNYLTKNAPPAIKELFGEMIRESVHPDSDAQKGEPNSQKPTYFAEIVWPILESKCVPCHREEKHKGGFRLDTQEYSITPGDSEETPIVPNDPMSSFLVELISMEADSDEVMPPSGKEPLSSEEKEAIVRWIREGASYSPVEMPQ
ncbi:hypothetical protein OAG77_01860 [bacterium]|jgi:uncharacterized membrane protein|nr:hypothetical protein [Verrucomicrobiota bacterium]MDB4796923.1 hypothetical protein [bacterium]